MKNHRHSHRPGKAPGFPRELSVLYEDDAVVVVDKPPGLLAVPVQGSDHVSALSLLRAELRATRQHAFVVHRIDRFTSGILLFAKTQPDRQILIEQFLQHTPVREYLAIVRGHLADKEGTLVHHFRREGMFQKATKAKDPRGARAELGYSVERVLKDATLVRVVLKTGLQNQIRVQFATAGHPVIGDRKYVPREALEKRIARVALHACRLEFLHPRSRKLISIDSEPPKDFQFLVRALSRQNSKAC